VTSAEMTSELKDSISHRGKALASLTIALKA
ncbi:MAG: non-canonical purine NTP pyrophosphatase, partial [Candidatus Nanopelagicales bacterium]